MIDRRRFLAALAATVGLSTLAGSVSEPVRDAVRRRIQRRGPDAWRRDMSSVAPWTEYFGAVQDRPAWASVQRGGVFADASGEADVPALRAFLADADLLSWSPPHPSQRTADGVAEFMTTVRETSGTWWRDRVLRAYREAAMAGTGVVPTFPLWDQPTSDLASEMVQVGVQAIVTCVEPRQLDASFAGRRFDGDFLRALPPHGGGVRSGHARCEIRNPA